MMGISVEAVSREGYRAIAGVDIDYEAFRANVKDLFDRRKLCKLYIKIADTGLDLGQIDQFYADFEGISDFIAIEKLMGWSNSGLKDFTLGTNPDTYDGLPFTPKEVCPYPFYAIVVNANGTVSVCANDWSHKALVGDVRQSSLKEIWEGEAMMDFRIMMLTLNRNQNPACSNCFYLKLLPDNLDADRLSILRRLRASSEAH
jgi:radical SAM protein with 4Fe4S-binding SPASM domain